MRMPGEPQSWDVALGGWWLATHFCTPFQQHLLTGDVSRGMTGTGEHWFGGRYIPPEFLRGELAESWELKQDPLRIVWHIRPGCYFPAKEGVMESREFTADDVVFSIDRRCTSTMPDPPWYNDWITNVYAEDEYTAVTELAYPYPDWPYLIGWGCWSIMQNPEMVEAGIDDWHNAVGTGPFMLTDYVTASLVEYSKNPIYWDTTTIDGEEYQLPFIDKLVWPIILDEASQLAALRTGQVDLWMKAAWQYGDTLADTSPDLVRWDVQGWAGYTIVIRQDDGAPMDILDVRKALSMAIDRQEIIDTLYGGSGVLLNYPIAADIPETIYTPIEKMEPEIREILEFDQAKARDLLAGAGYSTGFDCECLLMNTPMEVDIMSLIKDYWADINVDLTLTAVDPAAQWGLLTAQEYEDTCAYFQDSPTPTHGFYADWGAGALGNVGNWEDPVFLDMFAEYGETAEIEEAEALLKECNLYLISQVPAISLPGPNHYRFAWPWVKNYEGESNSEYQGSVGLQTIIWIDQDLKAEMGY